MVFAHRLRNRVPVLAVLLLLPSLALSDVPPEVRLHAETRGQEYQRDVAAASHEDGSWTVAWQDFRTGVPSIYVRTFQADGDTVGPANPITDGFGLYESDITPSPVNQPDAVSLGAGRTFLVWYEIRGGNRLVRAAVIEQDRVSVGPVTVADISRSNTRRRPKASLSGDRILVVWQEGLPPLAEVWGQVFSTSLESVGGNFRLDGSGPPVQQSPVAVATPDGWIASWSEEGTDDPRVVVRRISREAQPLGAVRSVSDAAGYAQREPALAPLGDGAVVIWTESREGIINLNGITIAGDLEPLAPAFRVVDQGATISPREPLALALAPDRVLVAWMAGPGTNPRFYARAFEPPSSPLGSPILIEDPEQPPGGSLILRGLVLMKGSASAARILWYDPREEWDLVYWLDIDGSGAAQGGAAAVDEDEGTASQVLPSVAMLPDKRSFVVWEDFQSGGLRIHGAYLDAAGQLDGTSFAISEATGGSVSTPATNMLDLFRNRPAVCATTDGYTIAAWSTIRPGGTSRVYYQVFDPGGGALGFNGVVQPGDGGSGQGITQGSPSMAPRRNGGYFLTWRDTSVDPEGSIYMLPHTSDGTVVGDSVIRVVDDRVDPGTTQISPSVATSEDGEAVVAWLDDRLMLTNFDVYIQRFGPAGNKIGNNLNLNPEEEGIITQSNVDVAASRDRYVVVWDDDALAGGGIAGVLVTLPTAARGAVRPAEEYTYFKFATGERSFKYPRVAMAGDGRFLVTYWDTAGDSARVLVQRFTAQADRLGPPYSVVQDGGSVLALPGDVALDWGRVQFVFSDSRERHGWDVRARRVSWGFDGEPTAIALAQWAAAREAEGIVLTWATPFDRAGWSYRVWRADEGSPAGSMPGSGARVLEEGVGPTSPGGAAYRWVDRGARPDHGYDYWIEDEHGSFAGPWNVRPTSRQAVPLRADVNPFRESVSISWSGTENEPRLLAFHGPDGRLIRRIDVSDEAGIPRGAGAIVWDGRDDRGAPVPSGVYWCRIATANGATRRIPLTRIR